MNCENGCGLAGANTSFASALGKLQDNPLSPAASYGLFAAKNGENCRKNPAELVLITRYHSLAIALRIFQGDTPKDPLPRNRLPEMVTARLERILGRTPNYWARGALDCFNPLVRGAFRRFNWEGASKDPPLASFVIPGRYGLGDCISPPLVAKR